MYFQENVWSSSLKIVSEYGFAVEFDAEKPHMPARCYLSLMSCCVTKLSIH